MSCKNHENGNGVNTCSKCGEWLCSDCSIEIDGRILCKDCLKDVYSSSRLDATAKSESPSGIETAKRYDSVPKYELGSKKDPRSKLEAGGEPLYRKWSLLFFFSLFFPPGVNYMYLGFIKRGLFILCSFFFSIYLIIAPSVRSTFFIPLLLLIMYLTSIFDAFNLRRRLREGELIEDNIEDIISFAKKYKLLLFIVFLIIVFERILSSFLPLVIIVIGIYLFLSSAKNRKG